MRFDLSKTYYPSTATLEEAQGVVAKLREMLAYSSGERAAELRDDLATWELAVKEHAGVVYDYEAWTARQDAKDAAIERLVAATPDFGPSEEERDAEAEEEDRRFEQMRDDKIMARYERGQRG